MSLDDVASAKRLVLGALLLYMLWLVAGRAYSFAEQVKRQDQEQKQTLQMLERTRQREAVVLQQQKENLDRQRMQPIVPTQAERPNGGKNSPQKMPASAVVKRLRQVNAFGVVASHQRLLHCTDNAGAWDYTCVFHGDPINSTNWVQFGVLVDNAHIIEMSDTYPAGAPLPPPLSLATR
jgi:hypothetical protein